MELLWLDVPRRTAVRVVGIKTDCYYITAVRYRVPLPQAARDKGPARGAKQHFLPPSVLLVTRPPERKEAPVFIFERTENNKNDLKREH